MKGIHDKTIEKNYQKQWMFLVKEYEQIKQKKHPHFKTTKALCQSVGIAPQTFYKFFGRYKQTKNPSDLLPQKRGPKWKTRRPDLAIEKAVIEKRKLGYNKYEIYAVLLPLFGDKTPSVSGIYNILKRYNMNRKTQKQKEEKRKIIKEQAGELCHVDCHYLPKNFISGYKKKLYLVGIIDSCTRLAWVEVVRNIKSLSVMFATLKSINFLSLTYGIQFKEMLSDNGSEFSSRGGSKENHPFERMLEELGIKHRYTRPYRPQTNGKIERFWRTLNEDVLDGTTFDSVEELKNEIQEYMFYFNEKRGHQSLNGLTPKQFLEKKISQRIT